MARLSRVQQQRRTRETVLTAALAEFAEFGFAEAKVDRIAERAELTRGAVYSNFPSKRALYLAVLLDLEAPPAAADRGGTGLPSTLEAFARVWLARLPLMGDSAAGASLRLRSLTGVFDAARGPALLAAVARLEALLLALALESRAAPGRRVRLAELVFTLLDGACLRGGVAPGSVDPFDVARACGHLGALRLDDEWDPPHRPYVSPATAVSEPWSPPAGLTDLITGAPVVLGDDGLVMVLGARRLGAAEEAIRQGDARVCSEQAERRGDAPVCSEQAERRGDAPVCSEQADRAGGPVTVVIVTSDPAELGALIRLRVRDLAAAVRRVLPEESWPPFRLVLDDDGVVPPALGVALEDKTEVGVRVRAGLIAARAAGPGAALALEAHV